eukprot:6190191-Pleurochrysis_carterae.AAC.3
MVSAARWCACTLLAAASPKEALPHVMFGAIITASTERAERSLPGPVQNCHSKFAPKQAVQRAGGAFPRLGMRSPSPPLLALRWRGLLRPGRKGRAGVAVSSAAESSAEAIAEDEKRMTARKGGGWAAAGGVAGLALASEAFQIVNTALGLLLLRRLTQECTRDANPPSPLRSPFSLRTSPSHRPLSLYFRM